MAAKKNKENEKVDKQPINNNGLKLLISGVIAYLLGIFVIVGGLIHDVLILGGAVLFIVGIVSLIKNRKKA